MKGDYVQVWRDFKHLVARHGKTKVCVVTVGVLVVIAGVVIACGGHPAVLLAAKKVTLKGTALWLLQAGASSSAIHAVDKLAKEHLTLGWAQVVSATCMVGLAWTQLEGDFWLTGILGAFGVVGNVHAYWGQLQELWSSISAKWSSWIRYLFSTGPQQGEQLPVELRARLPVELQ